MCYNILKYCKYILKGVKAMKKMVFSVVCAALAVCFLLSSCDSAEFIRPVNSLISPPVYYEEYAELVEAFNDKVSKNASLCSPNKGEHRSAIVVEDLDSDGETEALIFYIDSTDPSVARMHYFDIVDGRWISCGDFTGYGNEVEKLVITDMDSDGSSELVVIWRVSGVASNSIMSVYRSQLKSDEYKEISNEACSVCEVVDIDSDSRKEIFFISQTQTDGIIQRLARVMKLSGNEVVLMGETKIDPNISAYTSFKTEKVSGDSPLRIYVDALKGESQMITELIYWDKDKSELCAPLLDPETLTNTSTLRYQPIACADINNDGIIDIPVQRSLLATGDDSATTVTESIYITEWIDFISGNAETVQNSLVNYTDGYMICLEKKEIETTGIRNYGSQSCWVVYKTDGEGNSVGELYSVLKIDAERWKSEDFSAYITVVERAENAVCVYITQNGKSLGIDEDYIAAKILPIP